MQDIKQVKGSNLKFISFIWSGFRVSKLHFLRHRVANIFSGKGNILLLCNNRRINIYLFAWCYSKALTGKLP